MRCTKSPSVILSHFPASKYGRRLRSALSSSQDTLSPLKPALWLWTSPICWWSIHSKHLPSTPTVHKTSHPGCLTGVPNSTCPNPNSQSPSLIHPKLPSQLSGGSITLPGAWLSLCSFPLPYQGLREPLSALPLKHIQNRSLPSTQSPPSPPENCLPIFPTSHLFLIPLLKFSTQSSEWCCKSMNKIMTRLRSPSLPLTQSKGQSPFHGPVNY